MRRLSRLILVLALTLTACGLIRPTRAQVAPIASAQASTLATVKTPAASITRTKPPVVAEAALAATITPEATAVPVNPGAPDVANYAITVRLDAAKRQLTGSETISYRNTTQKPIPDLEFHLYLNAFKSQDTLFMRESGGQLRGDVFNPENSGWIEVSGLRVTGGEALKLELQEDGTLARAGLPSPVAPGQVVQVDVDFQAQLPQVFARTGWALDAAGQPFFLVGQWFPKLGVWTEKGWNAYPFHGNSEFFADFGDYDVSITLPAQYAVGATGLPAGTRPAASGERTVSYAARGVIDFAWVASPTLKTASRQVSGVEILYLYLPEHDWSVQRVLDAAEDAVRRFGDWYYPYPYTRLTVVDVPEAGAGAGGMEYPTFVTAGASGKTDPYTSDPWTDSLAITVVHEIAHQWFQSTVATNEAEEPWLDEGFADYSTIRQMIARYGLSPESLSRGDFSQGFLAARRRRFTRQPNLPMDGKAWDYPGWDPYVVAVYAKPDMALMTLERELGEETMTRVLRAYAQDYRFAHPTTADLQKVAVSVSGQPLDWFFNGLVYHGETLNYVARAINGNTISVERQGDLVIPVDIQVTLDSGARQTIIYDGKAALATIPIQAASPVKSFDIDPQHKLILELDWADNSLAK